MRSESDVQGSEGYARRAGLIAGATGHALIGQMVGPNHMKGEGIWWNVALPLAKPVLAVVIVFNVLNVWNEYILALIIFDSKALMPLQVALVNFQGEFITRYPLLMAGVTITALPVIAVYIFMQKHIVEGVTQGAVIG